MVLLPSYLKFTDNPDLELKEVLEELRPDKVAVLVDENTQKYCFPKIKNFNQRGKRDKLSAKYISQREGYRHFVLPLSITG